MLKEAALNMRLCTSRCTDCLYLCCQHRTRPLQSELWTQIFDNLITRNPVLGHKVGCGAQKATANALVN